MTTTTARATGAKQTPDQVLRAGLYLRVSQDRAQGRSVAEQEHESRQVCTREGWDVIETYQDNDRGASRYSKKSRPEFIRLQDDIKAGRLDIVVCWEASRLQRDLGVYAELRRICEEHKVLWSYGGTTYDMSKPEDRFRTGLDALLSENEVDKTRERNLRAIRSNVVNGKPHGKILYGYVREYDPLTKTFVRQIPDPVKSLVVKEAARRVASGESCRSIAVDFNKRGISIPRPKSEGKNLWDLSQIKRMVTNPGYIGKRIHKGQIVRDAVWDAILDEETFYACVRRLNDPSRRSTRDTSIKYLLSGLIVCGVCGGTVRTTKQRGGYRTYICLDNFCTARKTSFVDEFISDLVIERLSRPDVLELLSSSQSEFSNQISSLAEKRARLDELADLAAKGEISPQSFARMEATILPEIDRLEKESTRKSLGPVLSDVTGPDAGRKWEQLSIQRKRAIIRALFVEIKMLPVGKIDGAGRVFDPRKIKWTWREEF